MQSPGNKLRPLTNRALVKRLLGPVVTLNTNFRHQGFAVCAVHVVISNRCVMGGARLARVSEVRGEAGTVD